MKIDMLVSFDESRHFGVYVVVWKGIAVLHITVSDKPTWYACSVSPEVYVVLKINEDGNRSCEVKTKLSSSSVHQPFACD